MKRVTQKKGKAEFAAKFISARGKRKALALREMDLLSELDNERILYFHDAFEKKNVVVLITELYPFNDRNIAVSSSHLLLTFDSLTTEALVANMFISLKWKKHYLLCTTVSNFIHFIAEQKCT